MSDLRRFATLFPTSIAYLATGDILKSWEIAGWSATLLCVAASLAVWAILFWVTGWISRKQIGS